MRLWAILFICVLTAAGLLLAWKPYHLSISQPPSSLSVEVEEGEVHVGAEGRSLSVREGETARRGGRGDQWALQLPAEAPVPPPAYAPRRILPRPLSLAGLSPRWIVEGDVVDSAGLPLPSASVFVATLETSPRDRWRPPLALLRSGRTDLAGRYRLAFGGAPGLVILGASREGCVPAYLPLSLPDEGGRMQYRLTLATGAALYGSVKENLTGRPIPGARIRVREAGDWRLETGRRSFEWSLLPPSALADSLQPDLGGIPQEVATDASGQFRLSTVSPLGLFSLEVSAPGYLSRRDNSVKLADCPLSLVLNRGGSIAGVVVERDTDRPVPGATVYAMDDWRIAGEAVSRSDGGFTLEQLSPGTYRLLSRRGGWINWFYADSPELTELSPPRVEVRLGGSPADVRLLLVRGVSVSGTVANRLTNAPIAGAVLRLSGQAFYAPYPDVRTDRLGRYSLSGLYPGRFSLAATAAGYARVAPWGDARRSSPPGRIARLAVSGQDDLEGVDFALEPERTIDGRVVDEQGEGVEGVPVAVQYEDYRSFAGSSRTSTGPHGEFEIDGLYGGYSLRVVAMPRQRAPVYSEALFLPPGENLSGVELVLAPGGSVSGHVRSSSGEPREDVAVEYRLLEGERSVLDTGRARTDAQGYYLFSNVPQGNIQVRLETGGWRPESRASSLQSRLTSQTFALGAEEERGDVDFVLDGDRRGVSGAGNIRGRVVDREGHPIAGAVVRVGRAFLSDMTGLETRSTRGWPDRAEQAAFTGGDGGFDLRGLVGERYRLSTYHRDYQDGSLPDVRVGAEAVEIRLAPAPRLVGRVVGQSAAADEPVPSYQLRLILLPPTEDQQRAPFVGGYEIHQQPDGRFSIPVNRPGRYRVEVDVDDGRRGSSPPLVVGDHDSEETTIVVEQKYVLRGRVTAASDGRPITGAKVAVFSLNRLQLQRRFFFVPLFLGWRGVANSDTEGNFKITGLPEPVDSVWVFHPQYAVAYLPNVPIEETDKRPLDVRLEVGATLSVSVRDATGGGRGGLPRSSVRVRFPSQNDLWQDYTVGRDGSLLLPHCPPGPAMVELVDPPDWATTTHWQGDLPSGGRVEVSLGAR